jgi:DNA polymerase-3 subunit gamma/tau
MSYKALYQKYRSKTFEDVVGQEYVVKSIRNSVHTNKISHAYLFCGPRGTGKTTMARLLAKAVNCQDPEHAPCQKCDDCIAADNGTHPDIIEMNAANTRGIDDIRSLINSAMLAPMQGRYKVYIIDEAHQLSGDAASALLKILEEPPAHDIFVLATTDPQKMFPTIISRCQRYDFSKVREDLITAHLKKICAKEQIEIEDAAAEKIAQLADGGMRDALSILDQCAAYTADKVTLASITEVYGLTSTAEKVSFLEEIAAGNVKEVLSRIDGYYLKGIDLIRFTGDLTAALKETLIYRYSKDKNLLNLLDEEQAAKLYEGSSGRRILAEIDVLMAAQNAYRTASSVKDYLEIACLKMMESCMHDDAKIPAEAGKREPAAAPAKPEPPVKKAAAAAEAPAVQTEAPQPEPKPAVKPEAPAETEPATTEPAPAPIERPAAEEPVELDEESLLAILVQCDKASKARDAKQFAKLPAMVPSDIDSARYATALAQTQLAASGSDCMIVTSREKAVARNLSDPEFNRGLYRFLKQEMKIDKMVYAVTQEQFRSLTALYIDRMNSNSLPAPMKIQRYADAPAKDAEEKEQDVEKKLVNLFGDTVQIVEGEK